MGVPAAPFRMQGLEWMRVGTFRCIFFSASNGHHEMVSTSEPSFWMTVQWTQWTCIYLRSQAACSNLYPKCWAQSAPALLGFCDSKSSCHQSSQEWQIVGWVYFWLKCYYVECMAQVLNTGIQCFELPHLELIHARLEAWRRDWSDLRRRHIGPAASHTLLAFSCQKDPKRFMVTIPVIFMDPTFMWVLPSNVTAKGPSPRFLNHAFCDSREHQCHRHKLQCAQVVPSIDRYTSTKLWYTDVVHCKRATWWVQWRILDTRLIQPGEGQRHQN